MIDTFWTKEHPNRKGIEDHPGNDRRSKIKMSSRRKIALTFDDAPSGDGGTLSGVERSKRLVEALQLSEVKGAMFFVLTGNISKVSNGEARLRSYTDAGHFLANHTHSHHWLRNTEVTTYMRDIDLAINMLKNFDNVAPFFRYPYLDEGRNEEKRLKIRDEIRIRGLENGYVTIDNYDWYMQELIDEACRENHQFDISLLRATYVDVIIETVEFYDSIASKILGRSPSHILLLHENDLAALFVGDLVRALKSDSWEIVPALQAYQDEISRIFPSTHFNGQGRIAAIAHAAGEKARDLIHKSEDEDYLRKLFRDRSLIS